MYVNQPAPFVAADVEWSGERMLHQFVCDLTVN
jgi:hypothetical protein